MGKEEEEGDCSAVNQKVWVQNSEMYPDKREEKDEKRLKPLEMSYRWSA